MSRHNNLGPMKYITVHAIQDAANIVFKKNKSFSRRGRTVCWWDDSCTNAVNVRKQALRKYTSDPTLTNFVEYKKVCAEVKTFRK